MVMTDPIADFLTRIRNANQMCYSEVEIPASKLKIEIAKLLKNEGFISDYKIKENNSLRYYSLLSSIFIKYQLFNKLDELENIVKNLM